MQHLVVFSHPCRLSANCYYKDIISLHRQYLHTDIWRQNLITINYSLIGGFNQVYGFYGWWDIRNVVNMGSWKGPTLDSVSESESSEELTTGFVTTFLRGLLGNTLPRGSWPSTSSLAGIVLIGNKRLWCNTLLLFPPASLSTSYTGM